MNSTKLYQFGNLYFLQLSNGVQYTINGSAFFRSSVSVDGLEETTFDNLQGPIDNAISMASELVTDINELKALQALIQEKAEDFE